MASQLGGRPTERGLRPPLARTFCPLMAFALGGRTHHSLCPRRAASLAVTISKCRSCRLGGPHVRGHSLPLDSAGATSNQILKKVGAGCGVLAALRIPAPFLRAQLHRESSAKARYIGNGVCAVKFRSKAPITELNCSARDGGTYSAAIQPAQRTAIFGESHCP
jgi:hypothetical protein